MTLKRAWIPSPNYTFGNYGRRLLVLHTSEGAQTYQALGNFFTNPANQVSSHVGIDDTRGTIGEYVKRGNSAWTASGANTVAIQAEFCTPSGASANWSTSTWKNQHADMLSNAADWLSEESRATGIPLVHLTPSQAQGNVSGVCEHKDLGAWGGGHYDCGDGFPMDYVLDMARGGTTEAWTEGIDPMICVFINQHNGNEEVWELNDKGRLYLRYRPPDGAWSESIPKGDGYVGSPSYVNREDGIDVFVQEKGGGVVVFKFDPDNPTWVKQTL